MAHARLSLGPSPAIVFLPAGGGDCGGPSGSRQNAQVAARGRSWPVARAGGDRCGAAAATANAASSSCVGAGPAI